MTRLSERLAQCRAANEKALVCYVMAGDPNPSATREIVRALDRAGVDAIELGVPFSDPLADGPSIQAAAHRALSAGMTVRATLELVRDIRKVSSTPLVLMTYYNPVLRYGLEAFARDAHAAGADGTILVDLTPEESEEWIGHARREGLDTIFLVAPTSTPARVRAVAEVSTGFVYCVSRTGVTGTQHEADAGLAALIAEVRKATDTPALVGFGISRQEHVRRMGALADGVIVGSALVDVIAAADGTADVPARVEALATALKAATKP